MGAVLLINVRLLSALYFRKIKQVYGKQSPSGWGGVSGKVRLQACVCLYACLSEGERDKERETQSEEEKVSYNRYLRQSKCQRTIEAERVLE